MTRNQPGPKLKISSRHFAGMTEENSWRNLTVALVVCVMSIKLTNYYQQSTDRINYSAEMFSAM